MAQDRRKRSEGTDVPPTRLAALQTAKAALEREIPNAEGSALAAVVREYRATLAEIEALSPKQEVDVLDEIRARREARSAGADADSPGARRGQSRRSNGSHRTG